MEKNKANKTGFNFEKSIHHAIRDEFKNRHMDLFCCSYATYLNAKNDIFGDNNFLVKNFPVERIGGKTKAGRSEFLLKSKTLNLDVLIECKWQQESGSVGEKLIYTMLNAHVCEKDVIIVYGGDQIPREIISMLKMERKDKYLLPFAGQHYKGAREIGNNNIEIWSQNEMIRWINNGFCK